MTERVGRIGNQEEVVKEAESGKGEERSEGIIEGQCEKGRETTIDKQKKSRKRYRQTDRLTHSRQRRML